MPTDDQPQDPSFIEGVKEGIADSEAGRVSSLEDVVGRLNPPMPDVAKLTDGDIQELLYEEFGKHLPPLMRITIGEKLIRDATAKKAWHARDAEVADLQGKWTESQMEVYKLQEQLDAAQMSHESELLTEIINKLEKWQAEQPNYKEQRDATLAELRELLDVADRALASWADGYNTVARERDAAQEQVRALEEVLQRVVPQPYYCEDCGYFAVSDEYECCSACGAQLEIVGFASAIAAIKEAT